MTLRRWRGLWARAGDLGDAGPPRPLAQRLLWMVAIWCGGVAVLIAAAAVIRVVLRG